MNKMQTVELEVDDSKARKKRARKKQTRWGIMLAIPLALLAVGLYWWLSSGTTVETDNAAVKQDIVSVSAQINGPIAAVLVKNGDQVKRGDVLFRIDPASFQVALEEAEARLAAARLQTTQLDCPSTRPPLSARLAIVNHTVLFSLLNRSPVSPRRSYANRYRSPCWYCSMP